MVKKIRSEEKKGSSKKDVAPKKGDVQKPTKTKEVAKKAAKKVVEKKPKSGSKKSKKQESSSESESEEEKPAPKKSKKDKKEKKQEKKESSSEESSSESESESSSEEEKPAPKQEKKEKKQEKKESSSEESSSDSESESSSEEEKPAPKQEKKEKKQEKKESSSEESSSDSESESSSEEEEKKESSSESSSKSSSDSESEAEEEKKESSSESESSDSKEEKKSSNSSSSESDSDSDSSDSDSSSSDASSGSSEKKRKAEDVEEEKPAKVSKPADSNESCTLFVGRLSWSVDDQWLGTEFEEYGTVVGARVIMDGQSGRSKGYGYVDFDSPEAVKKACEVSGQKEIDGRAVNLDVSAPRPPKSEPYGQQRAGKFGDQLSAPSDTVFVGNLSFNVTEEEVGSAFATCGDIQSVRLPTDPQSGRLKGFGYVTFSDIDSAKRCVEMNGHFIAGRPSRLDFSTPRTGGGGRGGFGGGRGRGAPRGGGARGGARSSNPNRGSVTEFSGNKVTFD
ncbi:nucleolar protein required for rRNA processing [Schizosaccharomyces osmophilus]|uniref:Nucleolar protein required for rRNA processing n=1 Tax=Schizosaccharomyces osmophilus TaxID=2545709 RepID=A0AAF0AV57_9SCHI|nr:nucleolar protein required for rRNA processing [Schizosaccharomyces osmophilus]WBW73231.1 nucleolar protein required for rRNA processing [Schizosaccharomyces osmophilus]